MCTDEPTMSSDDRHTVCKWCGEDPNSIELSEEELEPVYATLHFYYNDPDSMRRLRECMQASDMKTVLFNFDQWLRNNIKNVEKHEAVLQDVRDRFWEICTDWGVDPYEEE